MGAKAIKLEFFLYSNLIYVLRHTEVVTQQLERLQRDKTKGIWMNKTAAVASDILCFPENSVGIGLPNIKLKTFAAAIRDWNNTFVHSNLGEDIQLNQLKGSKKKFFCEFRKSLKCQSK